MQRLLGKMGGTSSYYVVCETKYVSAVFTYVVWQLKLRLGKSAVERSV